MFVLLALAILIASLESLACDTGAPLPKLGQPFDWSKYNGTWYETITTFNPIAVNVACLVTYNVPLGMSERGDDAVIIYNNGMRKHVHFRLVDGKNGYFRHVDETTDEIAAVDFDQNGNFNIESAKEEEERKHSLITYLGDYQHYFAHIRCTPEGMKHFNVSNSMYGLLLSSSITAGWVVAIFTYVKTVSAELLLHIRNDLLKHGVAAPLRLNRCPYIDDI